MCGRYALTLAPEAVRRWFGYQARPNFPPRYNIAPTQPIPIVRRANGEREFALVRWGLVPSWAKDIGDIPLLINARAETAASKPSFRSAMKYRRCLIPADGFYEWRSTGPRSKQAYLIRRRDGGPFAFAGLWEDWMDPQGNELESAAIVTCAANEALAHIHHRMPVILEPEDYDAWLNSDGVGVDEAAGLLRPADDGLLEAVPVSERVNKVANDDASIQEPAAAPAAEDGEPGKAETSDAPQMKLF